MFGSTLVRPARGRRRILLLPQRRLLFVESTLCSVTLVEIPSEFFSPSARSNAALSPARDFSPALALTFTSIITLSVYKVNVFLKFRSHFTSDCWFPAVATATTACARWPRNDRKPSQNAPQPL